GIESDARCISFHNISRELSRTSLSINSECRAHADPGQFEHIITFEKTLATNPTGVPPLRWEVSEHTDFGASRFDPWECLRASGDSNDNAIFWGVADRKGNHFRIGANIYPCDA